MINLLRLSIVCYLCVFACGCGEQGETTYPVRGTVTLNGEPVSGAIVAFNPKGPGKPASGVTDQSGAYQLTTNFGGDGAVAGDYSVTIVKYESSPTADGQAETSANSEDAYDITDDYPEGYDEMAASAGQTPGSKNLLPRIYANDSTSALIAQVQPNAHDNVFDFQLKR